MLRIATVVLTSLLLFACGKKPAPAEPEQKRGRMTVTDTIVEVIDHILFGVDSAELSDDSRQKLDATVATLEGNPDITKVEAQGHADTSDADPAGISQARADAVVAYLVSKGIAPERVVAKGYGTDKAVEPAEGIDPAALQRSVMFMILERPGYPPTGDQ